LESELAKVTAEQISAAYQVSKNIFSKKIKRAEGIELLSNTYHLNKASAGDFINCFKCLMEGRVFQRAMSSSAMDFFMSSITTDFSIERQENALNALYKHIEYWESHYKTNALSMRKIANYYLKGIEQNLTTDSIYQQLEQSVAESLKLTSYERLNKIRASNPIPKKILVSSTVYQRNQHVVAERLNTANGTCERCNKKAPFLRAKDNTPYLEVHHKKQLGHGGLDVLENTIALCPNCHRELHFGI